MFNQMVKNVQTVKALPFLAAAASADRSGAILDMAAYKADAVRIGVFFSAIEASSATTVKAEYGDDSGLSDAAAISGLSVAVDGDDDDKMVFLDIVRPTKRYLRVVIDKDASHTSDECAWYDLYQLREVPVTQGSDVVGVDSVAGV